MYKIICKIELYKCIVLVVYDSCKQSLLVWMKKYVEFLKLYILYVIGMMGNLFFYEMGLGIYVLLSGLMGGD